ncbi:MAG: ThuA domain-containing protein [Planctomycetaceae bacterium]
MSRLSAIMLLFSVFLIETPSAVAQPAKADSVKPSRVLMLTQSAGFRHGSVTRPADKLAPAEISMIQLGKQTGLYTVDCTQDAAADFTKENLQNYDIVMFYTTLNLPIADNDLQYFLNDWLKQKGHGFIGFHSASDTFHDYQPYWDMVGGTFDGHPWGAGTTVTISVHEPDHPTMKPFGSEFQIRDEIYQYKNWQPEKVRVLMSLDMSKCEPSKPYHVPVAWVKSWGDGRVYYNNLGHNETTWADQRFLDSVTAGVKWIRGDVDGESAPNPDVSAAQEDLAKQAASGN